MSLPNLPRPEYGLPPLEDWIHQWATHRDLMADYIGDEMRILGFGLLVIHMIGSAGIGVLKGDTPLQIFVGRWLLPYPIFLFMSSEYIWYVGPLSLIIGWSGAELSGFETLNPGEILIQGVNFGLQVITAFKWFSFSGIGALIHLLFAVGAMVAHAILAYKVMKAIVESMFLFIVGQVAVFAGMSAWTFGSMKRFFKMSIELGLRIVFYHIVLVQGSSITLATINWVSGFSFLSLFATLTAVLIVITYGLISAFLPERYSREISEGLVENWGNPFNLLGR